MAGGGGIFWGAYYWIMKEYDDFVARQGKASEGQQLPTFTLFIIFQGPQFTGKTWQEITAKFNTRKWGNYFLRKVKATENTMQLYQGHFLISDFASSPLLTFSGRIMNAHSTNCISVLYELTDPVYAGLSGSAHTHRHSVVFCWL